MEIRRAVDTARRSKKEPPRTPSEAPIVAGLGLLALLHLVAAFVTPEILWGAHHLRFVPLAAQAVWFALLVVLLVPPARAGLVSLVERTARGFPRSFLARTAFATAIGILLFALLRSRNLFSGDGFLLSGILASGGPYEAGHAGYGTFLLARGLDALLRAGGREAGPTVPFVLMSALSGLAALHVAPRIAREITPLSTARVLVAGTVLLSGALVLFLGHVELYAPMHALVLVYLLFGARFLRGRSGLAAPSAALALASALHLTALVFLPSLVVLALTGPPLRRRTKAVFIGALALALVLLGAYVLTTRGTYEKEGALLPLAASAEAPYSLFSRDHLALAGNVLLLLLGGALLLPFLRHSGSARGSSREENLLVRFFGSAALGGVLFLLLVDPRLGSRDWDLLALPVFPLLLFLAAAFVSPCSSLGAPRAALVLGAMVLHAFPWVAANADPDRAVPMILAMTARDPHYDDPNLRASSALALLFSETGYGDASILLAERAARAKGGAVDYTNVGKAYAAKGEYDEAIGWFRRALAVDRSHADAEWCLGLALYLKGDRAGAEAALRSFLSLDPKMPDAYDLLGLILGQEGRIREAIDVLERGVAVDSTHVEFWRKLAILYERENRSEEAQRASARADRLRRGGGEAPERLADPERRRGG